MHGLDIRHLEKLYFGLCYEHSLEMEFAHMVIHLFINYEFECDYGAEFTKQAASESSNQDRWKGTVSLITHSHLSPAKTGKASFSRAQLVLNRAGTTVVLSGNQKNPMTAQAPMQPHSKTQRITMEQRSEGTETDWCYLPNPENISEL